MADKATLISLRQAAERGIERVRMPIWACPFDHFKIEIMDGNLGPWILFYSPTNKTCGLGRDPVKQFAGMIGEQTDECYERYNGALPDSAAYREEESKYSLADIPGPREEEHGR